MSLRPPIFELCKASAAVVALLGVSPLRVYPFGEAPQGCEYPYAVWQIVGGGPDNYLAGRPDSIDFSIQFDVWAKSEAVAMEVAQAIELAVELDAYVTSYSNGRQPGTDKFRCSMGIDFIQSRA